FLFSFCHFSLPPSSPLFPYTTLFRSRFSIVGLGFIPRLGSMNWWMRGHLWLGFLALPLALLHSGFRASGSLGIALVVLIALTVRSEEHTSELQSRGHLVCRLLLEKTN